MRSLTWRGSSSSRLAATISKSLYDVWVNAPAPVAVAHRPDVRDVGAQLVVDHDVAAPVDLDAGGLQPQVVGVGLAPHGDQQVAALDRLAPRPAV